jgi:hypothetical protein
MKQSAPFSPPRTRNLKSRLTELLRKSNLHKGFHKGYVGACNVGMRVEKVDRDQKNNILFESIETAICISQLYGWTETCLILPLCPSCLTGFVKQHDILLADSLETWVPEFGNKLLDKADQTKESSGSKCSKEHVVGGSEHNLLDTIASTNIGCSRDFGGANLT